MHLEYDFDSKWIHKVEASTMRTFQQMKEEVEVEERKKWNNELTN